MTRTIRTKVKDDKGNSATLEFTYRNGNILVGSEDFLLKNDTPKQPPEPQFMRVVRFPVCAQRHGGNAMVVGVRTYYHLGFMRDQRRSMLRIFRRLVQTRLDDNKFLLKLRDHCVQMAYRESVEQVRDLERQLVSAKRHRLAILQEMVANKKITKADPIKLPLIP